MAVIRLAERNERRVLTVVRVLKQLIVVHEVVFLEDVSVLLVKYDLLAGFMLHNEVVDEALIVGAVLLHVLVAVRLAEDLLEEVTAHGDHHAWLFTVISSLEDVEDWAE